MTAVAPLVPPDCDLQDFPFMPLHVARLRDSDMASEEAAEACWYGLLLWAASWHQLPAGSLPDSDAVMTKLVGLGKDVKTFRRVKTGAMRHFVLCADGRWYHPTVAEQAVSAWRGKLEQRWRTECARVKKRNQRDNTNHPAPTFEEFHATLPETSRLHVVPVPSPICPQGQEEDVPEPSPVRPQNASIQETEIGTERGTGTGTGTGIIDIAVVGAGDPEDDWPPGDATVHVELLVAAANTSNLDPCRQLKLINTTGFLAAWRRDGASWLRDVFPTVVAMAKKNRTPIASWSFFDGAVRQALAENQGALQPRDPVALRAESGRPTIADQIGDEQRRSLELTRQALKASNG